MSIGTPGDTPAADGSRPLKSPPLESQPLESLPVHRLDVPEPADLPFAIGSFDSIGPLSRAAFPHRHRFYEIAYLTGGRGVHMVDFVEYPIRPPQLCVIVPGQVHSWARATGVAGQVILFSDDFLLGNPDDRECLQALAHRPWLCPRPDDADRLAAAMAELAHEHRLRAAGCAAAMRALLHVLILRAGRLPGAAEPAVRAPDRASLMARRFTRLLERPGRADWSVPDFAGQLGVSVSYLTDVARRATGDTPGQLIRRARALEAKRLLAGSDLTVTRVADRLGFADAAYFCRFFRRETGLRPGDYRRSAHGIHHVPRV